MAKVVVIYSGGMDSFTALGRAIEEHGRTNVVAFSMNYGQRHVKELEYAKRVCEEQKIKHVVYNASALGALLGGSALTDNVPVPEGHYADESMKKTVVPNRNMILLAIAAGVAVAEEADALITGMHAGDHAIYPDCRPEFANRMYDALQCANYKPISLLTPFLYADKGDILKFGLDRGYDYGMSWTCYNGREKACGKCGSCVERLEAFANNNATDPLEYEEGV